MLKVEFDPVELRAEVVEEAARQVAESTRHDPDVKKRIEELVREALRTHCDNIVAPIVSAGIDKFVIQRTNEYGEKKGAAFTFTEYLVAQAEQYLMCPVNHNGEAVDNTEWNRKNYQTRLTAMIGKYLGHSIECAMKDAAKQFMAQVGPALAETCKTQINAVVADLIRKRN